jgi:hypothetical protein
MLATMLEYALYILVDFIVVGAVYLLRGPIPAAVTAAHLIPCELAWLYAKTRGFFTVLVHLIIIDLGLLFGGWRGLLVISFPAISFFWVGLIGFAFFVLPVQLREWEDAARCLMGFVTGYHYPYYVVRDDKVEEIFPGKLMPKGQFPGLVMAEAHTAVPLSTGRGLTRVAGPGVTFIYRGEHPYQNQVIDLRNQTCPGKVRATTRDGIDIEFSLATVFSVERWPPARPPVMVAPFSEAAVINAVLSQRVGADKWYVTPLDLGKNIARQVFAGYLLDRLLDNEKQAGLPEVDMSEHPADRRLRLAMEHQAKMPREYVREEIQKELTEAIHKLYGIKLLGAGFGNIDVAGAKEEDRKKAAEQAKTPEEKKQVEEARERVKKADELRDEIIKQRVASWQAEWMSESSRRQAQSEAEAVREIGRARAQSQMRMIQALAEGFAQAQRGGRPVRTDLVVLLRLLDAMEEMTKESSTRVHLPEEVSRSLAQIRQAALRAAGH